MSVAVTYSLCVNRNSNVYYQHVRKFTDEVIECAAELLMPSVKEFREHLRASGTEELRTDEEYVLELLSFGLLWKLYSGYALAVRWAPLTTLEQMAEWRKVHQRLKPAIDLIRGVLMTLFLFPSRGEKKTETHPTLQDVDRLCRWYAATGEFREQALRFIRWRAYWETMPASRWEKGTAVVFAFVDWFIIRSEEALGVYTENVEGFLEQSKDRYRWREDRVQ